MAKHSSEVERDLSILQVDYTAVNGAPFEHFYCPILFRDEDTDLSMGHVVNAKIPNSPRARAVQRSDVDNWYGSMFEADFQTFLETRESSLHDVMSKPHLHKRLRPRIRVDGEEVRHYAYNAHLGASHTPMLLDNEMGDTFRFVLDMRPEEIGARLDNRWDVATEADFRLAALVTMIKSAYLTLFHILGYKYALSPAGIFVGHDILGRFYVENKDKPKAEVVAAAIPFFQPYVNMMRPIVMYSGPPPRGTVEDRIVKACFGTSGRSYAMIVCVKTNHELHAVFMPAFNHPDLAQVYLDFLNSEGKETLRIFECKFDEESGCWNGTGEPEEVRWPKGHETLALE
jgi:hypothetical protein